MEVDSFRNPESPVRVPTASFAFAHLAARADLRAADVCQRPRHGSKRTPIRLLYRARFRAGRQDRSCHPAAAGWETRLVRHICGIPPLSCHVAGLDTVLVK